MFVENTYDSFQNSDRSSTSLFWTSVIDNCQLPEFHFDNSF